MSQPEQATSPPVKKTFTRKSGSPVQQSSQADSDESHRTEQLLHRHSVTPPQKQPQRRQSSKRDSFSSASSACTTSPDLGCLGSATSEAESDILQYSSDTALYYPGTDLVIDGWFQPCRCVPISNVCYRSSQHCSPCSAVLLGAAVLSLLGNWRQETR